MKYNPDTTLHPITNLLSQLRINRRRINFASAVTLAIMFRLGMGMAHAGVSHNVLTGSEESQSPRTSYYCVASGEQENSRLIDMLCPVCHALACSDGLEQAIHSDSRIFLFATLFSKSGLLFAGPGLPAAWSFFQSRGPPFF